MKRQATCFNDFGIIFQFMGISCNSALLPLVPCPGETRTCEPGDVHMNVYCIFIIAKNWK